MHPPAPETVNVRPVRILLECILVFLIFSCSFQQTNCKIIALLRVGAPPPKENPGSATDTLNLGWVSTTMNQIK